MNAIIEKPDEAGVFSRPHFNLWDSRLLSTPTDETESHFGQGTIFHVHAPEPGPPPAPAQKTGQNGLRGHNETILVVEDEPELRALVCEILRQYGYLTYEAGSGPEAIPIWHEHAGEIKLLLTDMVMPGNMTGRELAAKLKDEEPRLKVVFTSGYSREMVARDDTFKVGSNFLQKPYKPVALAKVVRECLDS